MLTWNKKFLTASSMVVLSVTLQACGGGSSSDDVADTPAAVPSFAGTYNVSLTKTSDTCNSGIEKSFKVKQTVTQSGRNITLVSGKATLQGSVDADNAGLSVSTKTTSNGIEMTTSTVYRTTSTAGLYGAGLSLVARSGNAMCSITFNGQAKRL